MFRMFQSGMPRQRLHFSLRHFLNLVQLSVQVQFTGVLPYIDQEGEPQKHCTEVKQNGELERSYKQSLQQLLNILEV